MCVCLCTFLNKQMEHLDQIQKILDNMKDPNTKTWKSVKPKALMDNCYRTMHCLFPHCFPTENKQADCKNTTYYLVTHSECSLNPHLLPGHSFTILPIVTSSFSNFICTFSLPPSVSPLSFSLKINSIINYLSHCLFKVVVVDI